MFGDLQRSRIVAYSAAFVALITMGSWVSIPFFPVPITLQTLFVLLSGAVMKRYAVIPVSLYILFGAIGLPVFHNGIAGIGVLLGPTGGYLLGFLPAALIVGLVYEHDFWLGKIIGFISGTLVILILGALWLCYSTGMAPVAAVVGGILIFLPGDAIKAGATYLIAKRLP